MRRSAVVVRDVNIPIAGLPRSLDGLRIAHVSDLHFRAWNAVHQAAQDRLASLDYDLLVATGDFAGKPRQWELAAELMCRFFGPLADSAPTYGVLGNHDEPLIATVPDLPLTLLRNRSIPVELRGTTVEMAGVEQNFRDGEDLEGTLHQEPGHALSVLLAHYPSTVFRVPPGRVDLVLSGHTHGGQIRWPLVGCVWTNDKLPVRMARGLHRVGPTWLHITAGVGLSAPVYVRINCPADVSVLTLRRLSRAEAW